jgi:hypothetical protein
MLVHDLSDNCLGGGVHSRFLATGRRLGASLTSGAIAAQQLLAKREADAKYLG